jgi:hypothetical protein
VFAADRPEARMGVRQNSIRLPACNDRALPDDAGFDTAPRRDCEVAGKSNQVIRRMRGACSCIFAARQRETGFPG